MIVLVTAVSMICFGCNRKPEAVNQRVERTDQTPPGTEKGGNSERGATRALASDATLGTILFTGLMVLHKDETKGSYEIGVIPATAHGHQFRFVVDGFEKSVPGKNWTVEITNAAPVAAMPKPTGRPRRRPDNRDSASDFNWVIDLEGSEFHDKELPLKEGVLDPIIHLPNGRLYTKYKSIDLERRRGAAGTWSDFGFVPEGLAIDVALEKDQKLILKNDSGAEVVLFEYPSPGEHTVKITNTLPMPSKASDFHLFYDLLFIGVPQSEQYDFDAKARNYYVPYNPRPNLLRTCCAMDCSTPLLSRRIDPLR
jgi:hypothetical protein